MSFLTYRVPALRAALTAPSRTAGVRSLSVSASRLAFSESDIHHENRSEEIDKHKKESLDKQKANEAEWKEKLASSSEAAIKADRHEADASAEDIKNLQKEAEQLGKQKR